MLTAVWLQDVAHLAGALLVPTKYLAGIVGLVCSAAGLYLGATGHIPVGFPIPTYTKLPILLSAGVIFACGWIGAGSATSWRAEDPRLRAGAVTVLMMPVGMALTLAARTVPLIQAGPRTFSVTRKARCGR